MNPNRPLRNVLLLLPQLVVADDFEIDYMAVSPAVLLRLAENAETAMRIIQLGLAGLGHLLARSAPEIEAGEIPAELLESLGWLHAEMADAAAVLHSFAAACRQATADYVGIRDEAVSLVRP